MATRHPVGSCDAAPSRRRALPLRRPVRCPGDRVVAAGLCAACTACAGAPSIFRPAGAAAQRIATLGWITTCVMVAVFVVVLALLLIPIIRTLFGRQTEARPVNGRAWIVTGVAISTVVLIALFVYSLPVLSALSARGSPDQSVIEVVGHRWWWEVRYPAAVPNPAAATATPATTVATVTANEIHIPTGVPVRVRITSADVIHSFWVPRLAGKVDLVPGQTNALTLEATRSGVYRGACAEFCGAQHAHMRFTVVAEPPVDYTAWLRAQRQPARPPTDPTAQAGLDVFLSAGCAGCHTIRGTPAAGQLGPDLTHVASRRTLAAGMLPNTHEQLARWVTHAQAVKPGAAMPDVPLDPQRLEALLTYLETLE